MLIDSLYGLEKSVNGFNFKKFLEINKIISIQFEYLSIKMIF